MVAESAPLPTGTPRKGDARKEDVLDRPDFNVTHYINEMFPTGAPSCCVSHRAGLSWL